MLVVVMIVEATTDTEAASSRPLATDLVRPILDLTGLELQVASDPMGGHALPGNSGVHRAFGGSEVPSDVGYDQPRLSRFGAPCSMTQTGQH